MEPVAIYLTGTAGAGKTTLTHAFQTWMVDRGYTVTTLNLDPGMEGAPYSPDVDIRDWVNLQTVMEEHRLGPNGAQVVASDLVAMHLREVKSALEPQEADYLLVDTPGQVELFAFRESSRAIVEELSGERSLLAFLFDPMLVRHPHGFVSLSLLAATVQFRFRLPMVHVLAKEDLLPEKERERIRGWAEEPDSLVEALSSEEMEREGIVSMELYKALESVEPNRALLFLSAQEERGMDDLYATVQQIFAGGEDLEGDGGVSP